MTGGASGPSKPPPSREFEEAQSSRNTRPQRGRVGCRAKPHFCAIVVHIYGLSKADIDKAIESIEKSISEFLIDKVMDDKKDQETISNLSNDQVCLLLIITTIMLY